MSLIDTKKIPNSPGVYLWKDENEVVVYVGKARQLKKRINQYLKGYVNSYKTQKMMQEVASIDYIITTSEKEALILERNLIAKYKPYYNIKLMDDKRYPYIKIHLLANQLKINLAYRVREKSRNIIYFGPFPSGFGAKKMSDFLNRMFIFQNGLPIRNQSQEFWVNQFNEAKKIVSHQKSMINVLKSKMEEAAKNFQYEIAQDIKDTLNALKATEEKQVMQIDDKSIFDVIACYEQEGFLSIEQLFYRQGMLLTSKKHVIEITTSVQESIRQFVSQYYAYNLKPTSLISNLDFETDLKLVIPQRGIKKQILKIALTNCKNNIEDKLAEFVRQEERTIGALHQLRKLLKLPKLHHILMIDNSNFANENPVAALVSYRNGIKYKNEYRKFKLETTDRRADVEYMRQALKRYFVDNKNPYPDLLVLDGGKQQVNEIKKLLPDIPLIGLVKDDNHRTRAIVTREGKELKIENLNLYNFLFRMQIEVDRFAKQTYQNRARKTTLEGMLKSINGVGDRIEQKLLTHFHAYSAIYNASEEELAQIVGSKLAKEIKKGLK